MNQIKVGAILNYVIIALNTLVGLAYTPYMLRCLGKSEYGLYSLVASIIAYLTILDFGFGNAIIRYTAKFRAEGKFQEQWNMFGMFLIVYIIIGGIVLIVGSILYHNIDTLFNKTMSVDDLEQARLMMLFLVLNLAITFPFSIYGSIITAYEDFIFQKLIQIIRIILCTFTLTALLYFGYKAVAMVVVQTIFNAITLLLNFLYCQIKLRIKVRFHAFDWLFLKEISIYSFWIFLNSIMDRVYWSTGQFVLGSISGTVAVASFSVAITLQQMYMMFSGSISNVLFPRVTTLVANNKSNEELSSVFIKAGRLQALVMMLVLSGFIVFGERFIVLWAGSEYSDSYIVTLIFFAALFVPSIQNIGLCIIQAKNQMKFRSLCYLIISLLSLGVQIYLAESFGALGCAIAIGGALFIGQGLIMNIYYYKVQQLDIILFWREIFSLAIFPILLTIICSFFIQYLNFYSFRSLFVEIVIFTCIYVLGSYHFGMNSFEKQTFDKFIFLIKDRLWR